MKTLKLLVTSALFSSVALTGAVQADNSLSSLIYEESANIYSETSYQKSSPTGILSYADDANKSAVWSTEFEEYVDPATFEQQSVASIGDINKMMASNPTAAGRIKGRETFIYNETAGEYHLQ